MARPKKSVDTLYHGATVCSFKVRVGKEVILLPSKVSADHFLEAYHRAADKPPVATTT